MSEIFKNDSDYRIEVYKRIKAFIEKKQILVPFQGKRKDGRILKIEAFIYHLCFCEFIKKNVSSKFIPRKIR